MASVLVLTGSAGAASNPTGSAPSFAAAKSYEAGSGPSAIAIGIAIASLGANRGSILLSRGRRR